MSVDELPFPAVRHGASGNALSLKRTHGAAFDVAPSVPISSGGGSGSFGESGSVRDNSVGDSSVGDGSGDTGGLPGGSANTGGPSWWFCEHWLPSWWFCEHWWPS